MGDTPEDIQDGFPSLTLAQINAVITWYLSHRAEVDEYIREVDEQAEKLRQEIESRPESIAFNQRLLEKIERYREQRLRT